MYASLILTASVNILYCDVIIICVPTPLKKNQNPTIFRKNSDVIIYEFFDYNCGYCKKSLDAITELLRLEYDLKVSFRDYPILAPSSRTAAKAALAAKLQGKYFALHSALMNMQGNLNDEKIYPHHKMN